MYREVACEDGLAFCQTLPGEVRDAAVHGVADPKSPIGLRRRTAALCVSTSTRRWCDAKTGGRIEGHSHRVRIVAASAVSICSVYRV
jgi:hypothetical protein